MAGIMTSDHPSQAHAVATLNCSLAEAQVYHSSGEWGPKFLEMDHKNPSLATMFQ